MVTTLFVDRSVLELKVARLSDYTLKREMREAITSRSVADFVHSPHLAYWQAYFEVLAGEIGSRGISEVKQARPQGGYKLDAVELKSRVGLAEYIGRYTQLHKSSVDKLTGCCPLHHDTHPSLFVYQAKQDWYCFGCCKGGDLITFVELINAVSFYEALILLSHESRG